MEKRITIKFQNHTKTEIYASYMTLKDNLIIFLDKKKHMVYAVDRFSILYLTREDKYYGQLD